MWKCGVNVDKEELLKALKYDREQYEKGYRDAKAEQQWIPCSERLPKENQVCIVTDETRCDAYEYIFCDETYDEVQGWTYLGNRIIAWMPMPEPWKGDIRE